MKNRPKAERLASIIEACGHTCYLAVRELEFWGATSLSEHSLMQKTFELMDACDLVLIDLSEKGIGIGFEAGYAFAHGKPLIVIAPEGTEISATLKGITNQCYFYERLEDISKFLPNQIA